MEERTIQDKSLDIEQCRDNNTKLRVGPDRAYQLRVLFNRQDARRSQEEAHTNYHRRYEEQVHGERKEVH